MLSISNYMLSIHIIDKFGIIYQIVVGFKSLRISTDFIRKIAQKKEFLSINH